MLAAARASALMRPWVAVAGWAVVVLVSPSFAVCEMRGVGVISPQNPISLPPDSEPEPDISVLRPECLRRKEVPTAEDVLLLIEISANTLDYDRDVKIPLYAKHGISEVWILNESASAVSIYRDPAGTTFRTHLTPRQDETISPLLLPNVRISLADLWQ
jgi:Uma2 family endonuclease